jgi:hypothetical protein
MTFFRKRTHFRSLAAIFAAYAVVLDAFIGGRGLSHQDAAAGRPVVICHGLGDSGGANDTNDNGKTPVKQFPCSLCCAVHAAGTLPASDVSIGIVFSRGVPLPLSPVAATIFASEHSPKSAQGPPLNV